MKRFRPETFKKSRMSHTKNIRVKHMSSTTRWCTRRGAICNVITLIHVIISNMYVYPRRTPRSSADNKECVVKFQHEHMMEHPSNKLFYFSIEGMKE